jgi:FkbM family methyltransferase
LAFEPDKDAMIELKSRLNSDSRVRFVAKAVGPRNGVVDFYVTTPAAGTNTVVPDSRRKLFTGSLRVQMTSLPDAFQEHHVTHAHLVKIDAEGFDFEILKGARPLLEQERISVIQLEYNHRWIFSRRYLFDVFALIEDLPYVVGKVTRSRVEVYKEWHPEIERYFESNYLCLHKDALSWFPHAYVSWNKSNTLSSAS